MPIKNNLLKSYPKSSDRSSMYISESPKMVDGFEDVTDDIRRGKAMFYDKSQMTPARYFQDRNGRVYIMNTWAKNPDIDGMTELFSDDIRSMLPKRDYIGGKPMEARIEAARRIPGFTGKVYERATAYGIDPNLLLHRLIREGYIDNRIKEYNGKLVPDSDQRNYIYTDEQPDYWKNRWNETDINGYEELGLDYTGSELLDGKYNLLDPSVTWQSVDWTDDEPGYQRSGVGMSGDLNAMIEGTAAAMKYRHNLAKERYNPKGNDEWYYTNAMFNMGQNNDKLDDVEYVRKQYQYPDYYNTYNLNTKSVGGLIERIVNVYGNDTQSIHQAIRGIKYNELKSGGKIPLGPIIPGLLINAKDKYLADYANRGNVVGYPSSVIGLLQHYVMSPYNSAVYDSSTPQRRSLFAKYFNVTNGLDFNPDDYIVESEYRPSVSKDVNAKYYTFKADSKEDVYNMFRNEAGEFKIDYGKDENGRYISIYDDWDLAPFGFEGVNSGTWQSNKNSFESFGAKPVELYDRIYESKDPELFANFYYDANIEKNGGKIHIKPSHRGRFTSLLKRTGKSASWFKAHGTPAQKRMATFALNSRHWKHEDGGPIQRAISSNKADVVLAAIRKMKSDVTP